jgi:hypothetical protein
VAWIIGWDLIIEYAVGNVAVAISWGNYCRTFLAGFGVDVPAWLSTDYRTAARIPGLLDHAPHLALSPFSDHNAGLEPGPLRQPAHVNRYPDRAVDFNPPSQPLSRRGAQRRARRQPVLLLDFIAWMRELVGKVAVVREQ